MTPYDILGSEAYQNPMGEISRLLTDVMDLEGWRAELRKLENGLYRNKKTNMGKKLKDHERTGKYVGGRGENLRVPHGFL
jgi:hypothetical protein